jgi:Rps23 Pro-64 3,4-dihydroxylase Tpa1-like proline 4-hydroxylase
METKSVSAPYGVLRRSGVAEQPFRYFLGADVLTAECEATLLDWFECDAPWRLKETDFYAQYEFDLRDVALPDDIAALIDDALLGRLRREMEEAFGEPLGREVQVVAHRLEPGQRIAIHNDMRPGGETHRLTVQLNRGLRDEDGGLFVLFNSDDADDIHRILRPVSGTAIGFAISPVSHHAVSSLHGGTRFTLVYSFHADRRR